MHELGMVTGVVESVRQAAEANHADKVLKVSLSVGEMTEAIEDALTFAYEAITDNDPLFSGSKLDITMVPPKSRCVECGHEFTHDRFHVMCPECGGFADLIEGKELRIDSIEVDIPDENEELKNRPEFFSGRFCMGRMNGGHDRNRRSYQLKSSYPVSVIKT